MFTDIFKRRNFFEGWYFKQTAGNFTIAFIPAYHIDKRGKRTASLQIITESASYCIEYSNNDFIFDKPLDIRLKNNTFSKDGIFIDLMTEALTIKAELFFSSLTPLKSEIMGPFYRMPFMQCKHGVISMKHCVNGYIILNGLLVDFKDGTGYIEKDSGSSFPDRYLWTQCYNDIPECAVMLSIANIPFLFGHFNGCLCSVTFKGREFRLATYLGAKILKCEKNSAIIKQGNFIFSVEKSEDKSHFLRAPIRGEMKRAIRESVSCKVRYVFKEKDYIIFDFTSSSAGFEYFDEKEQ